MGLFDHLFKAKAPSGEEKVAESVPEGSAPPRPVDPASRTVAPQRADPSAFLHPKNFVPRGAPGLTAAPRPGSTGKTTERRPTPAGAPPAADEIVLTLGDVLSRIPTPYLKSGTHDAKRELRFKINDLSSDIARGRAAVPLSRIAQLVPDIFVKEISREEDTEIRLPLQKLVEQIGLLRSRPKASGIERPLVEKPVVERSPRPPAPTALAPLDRPIVDIEAKAEVRPVAPAHGVILPSGEPAFRTASGQGQPPPIILADPGAGAPKTFELKPMAEKPAPMVLGPAPVVGPPAPPAPPTPAVAAAPGFVSPGFAPPETTILPAAPSLAPSPDFALAGFVSSKTDPPGHVPIVQEPVVSVPPPAVEIPMVSGPVGFVSPVVNSPVHIPVVPEPSVSPAFAVEIPPASESVGLVSPVADSPVDTPVAPEPSVSPAFAVETPAVSEPVGLVSPVADSPVHTPVTPESSVPSALAVEIPTVSGLVGFASPGADSPLHSPIAPEASVPTLPAAEMPAMSAAAAVSAELSDIQPQSEAPPVLAEPPPAVPAPAVDVAAPEIVIDWTGESPAIAEATSEDTARDVVTAPAASAPEEPPHELAPVESPELEAGEEKIKLSLAAILRTCPPEIFTGRVPHVGDHVRITLPFAPIDRQLIKGHVEISAVRFIEALPAIYHRFFVAKPGLKIPIPLEEVFQNLPSTPTRELTVEAPKPSPFVLAPAPAAEVVRFPFALGTQKPVEVPAAATPETPSAAAFAPVPLEFIAPAETPKSEVPPAIPAVAESQPAPAPEIAAAVSDFAPPPAVPPPLPAAPAEPEKTEEVAPSSAIAPGMSELIAGLSAALSPGAVPPAADAPVAEIPAGLPHPLPTLPAETAPAAVVDVPEPVETPTIQEPTPLAISSAEASAAPTEGEEAPKLVLQPPSFRPFIVPPPRIFGFAPAATVDAPASGELAATVASIVAEAPAPVAEVVVPPRLDSEPTSEMIASAAENEAPENIVKFSMEPVPYADLSDTLAHETTYASDLAEVVRVEGPESARAAQSAAAPLADEKPASPVSQSLFGAAMAAVAAVVAKVMPRKEEPESQTVAEHKQPAHVESEQHKETESVAVPEVKESEPISVAESKEMEPAAVVAEKALEAVVVTDEKAHEPVEGADHKEPEAVPEQKAPESAEAAVQPEPAVVSGEVTAKPENAIEHEGAALAVASVAAAALAAKAFEAPAAPLPPAEPPVAAESESSAPPVVEPPAAEVKPPSPPSIFRLPKVPVEHAPLEVFAPPALPIRRFDQDAVQALFMTEETLDLPKISRLAASLPGVYACVIATRDQACTGGNLPEGFDLAALLGLAPRVGEAASRMPIGQLNHFTLYGDAYSVSFFERNGLSLCAVHRPRSFVPGVREKLVALADELSR